MTKTFAKTLIIFASIILIALFVIGIVQTFILHNLEGEKQGLSNQISQIERDIGYINTPEYQDGYVSKENEVGGENDKIYR